MPDKKPRTVGGLNSRTVVLILGGSVGAYLLYRWYQARQASASLATSGGNTIPNPLSTGGTGSTTGNPTSLAQWIQTALANTNLPANYSTSALYNDIQAWLNGSCVSANGYNIIGSLIVTLGLPPGYTPPALAACPGTGTTPTPPSPQGPGTPTPSYGIPPGFVHIASQTVAQDLLARGYDIVRFGNSLFYFPGQNAIPGKGLSLQWIPNMAYAKELEQAGFTIVQLGNGLYWDPGQKPAQQKIKT